MQTAAEIIALLGLQPLPEEGGWYAETYRGRTLPGGRAASTAIYYLLEASQVSRLHRLPNDEVWHFYTGDPVELLVLGPPPSGSVHLLGADLAAGQRPQALVPAGHWQGARLKSGGRFALMGTTVAPGFEFEDFESGDRACLAEAFPHFEAMVTALTP